MHPKLIQAHLHMHGSSPARLAREIGVSHVAVVNVIAGRHKSLRLAAEICRAAQLSPAEAFPGQYPLLAFALPARAPSQPHSLQKAA
jgi:lambda repressor-like predicted transcriptional regulator